MGLSALLAFAALAALGSWQLHRLAWKRDLIARVEARVHAAPTPAPGPAAWAGVTPDADEYRHVVVQGSFRNDRETRVQAVTAFGSGFWVMTPLATDAGFTVLINRGFVPSELGEPEARRAGQIAGQVTVMGLLRMTEPKGAFLQNNDPAADRWLSRDVAAIAAARGIAPVAPYFIDAADTANPGGWPKGGLTVIAFPNNHLVYAIIWYALAALLPGAAVWSIRDERRRMAGIQGRPSRAGRDD